MAAKGTWHLSLSLSASGVRDGTGKQGTVLRRPRRMVIRGLLRMGMTD